MIRNRFVCKRYRRKQESISGKKEMKPVKYEFEEIQKRMCNHYWGYILQLVQGRKLTAIYHSHDFYEIIIIARGRCSSVINEVKYDLETDTIIVLRPGDCHHFLNQSEDIIIISLSVRKSEFEAFCDVYDVHLKDELCRGEVPVVWSVQHIYLNINARYREILEDSQEYDCKLFLAYLIKLYVEQRDRNDWELSKQFRWALKEMQKMENLKEGIQALEQLSGYSRSQLTRLMKRQFSKTPHDYILDLRLSAAYNELIFTAETIEEISEKLGYESLSHFNKIFKSKYGITPAMLRKQHCLMTI